MGIPGKNGSGYNGSTCRVRAKAPRHERPKAAGFRQPVSFFTANHASTSARQGAFRITVSARPRTPLASREDQTGGRAGRSGGTQCALTEQAADLPNANEFPLGRRVDAAGVCALRSTERRSQEW